ncbi:MAG: dienelactone hydrolase family protein [Maricaulaceae bacterium]
MIQPGRPSAQALLAQARTDAFHASDVFTADDIAHRVLKAGAGPGVLLLHELPGFVPEFWRLAHWLVQVGFTVWAPDLFSKGDRPGETLPTGRAFARVCVSREIFALRSQTGGPITDWLRALAWALSAATDRPVGVVGLCLTGNFAWTLAIDPVVEAPVAVAPASPVSGLVNPFQFGALQMTLADRATLARDDTPVMALRFRGDPSCRAARFKALERVIGPDRLNAVELDDQHKNPEGNPAPHALLTKDLIAETDAETLRAFLRVVDFLRDRLAPPVGAG